MVDERSATWAAVILDVAPRHCGVEPLQPLHCHLGVQHSEGRQPLESLEVDQPGVGHLRPDQGEAG